MLLDTLETLCSLNGVTGNEDEVRNYILERSLPYANEIRSDSLGNLMIFKKGDVVPPRRIMLAAHMDEVGLMITDITEDGYLRFAEAGGLDRRVIIGKRVCVGSNRIPGVVGCKAVHLTTAENRRTLPNTENMYIDIGAVDREDAEKWVHPGDSASFDDGFIRFGDNFIKARAIDDRIGCSVMLDLLESGIPCDCWFAFTVQEEVGCRGAAVAARQISPDTALILETTTAADLPGISETDRVCRLGGGIVIPFMDRGTIYDRTLYGTLSRLAEKNGIPWQTKTRIAGGTDASAVQRSGAGSQVAALSVPVRNIHSPACVARIDECDAQLQMARLFLEEMSETA